MVQGPHGGEVVILLALPVALFTCQIVFHHKIKGIFKKRVVWVTMSVVYLLYFALVAGIPNISIAFQHPEIGGRTWANPLNPEQSRMVSGVFALDLCQFISIFFPIALLIDPSRKVARALAPATITGGLFTLITRVALDKTTELTGSGIFLGVSSKVAGGDYPNHAAFYIYHIFNTFLAIAIMLNTTRTGGKGIIGLLIGITSYYAYVGLIIAATTATYSVAGLTTHDFMEGGNFKQITKIFHTSPGGALAIFHIITTATSAGFGAINEYVLKNKPRGKDDLIVKNKKQIRGK